MFIWRDGQISARYLHIIDKPFWGIDQLRISRATSGSGTDQRPRSSPRSSGGAAQKDHAHSLQNESHLLTISSSFSTKPHRTADAPVGKRLDLTLVSKQLPFCLASTVQYATGSAIYSSLLFLWSYLGALALKATAAAVVRSALPGMLLMTGPPPTATPMTLLLDLLRLDDLLRPE